MDGVIVADIYTARVKGTHGTLPRGYPWVMLVYYAIMGAVFGAFAFDSPLVGAVRGAVMFACGVFTVLIFRNLKSPAFSARPEGIQLGGQRHRMQIPWDEICEVRISPATNGALADVVMLPSVPVAWPRFPPAAEVMLSLVPFSYLFLAPPMLAPLTDPVRYRAPLWGTTADEVAAGLRPLAPESTRIVR